MESNKTKESLLQLALRMCRKHGQIKERITLLCPVEFLQAVQLCYMQVLKKHKKFGNAANVFEMPPVSAVARIAELLLVKKLNRAAKELYKQFPTSVLTFRNQSDSDFMEKGVQNICHSPAITLDHLSKLTLATLDFEEQVSDLVEREYGEFLFFTNHIDAVDILKLFLLELMKESDISAELVSMDIEVSALSLDPLQSLIMEVLNHQRENTSQNGLQLVADSAEDSLKSCVKNVTPVKYLKFNHLDAEPLGSCHNNNEQPVEESTTETTMQELVGELFRSYIGLLVNSRSQIAFAHVFNTPERGLSHQAFTQLKHRAEKKNISLYQMAMSVITQLRLGGQGYAPESSCGLLDHIKGLSLLMDMMNKLQQVLEETDCVRSSVVRVLGIIKKSLSSCTSQHFKRDVVEAVAVDLQIALENVISDLQQNSSLISPDKPACQGGTLTSRRPRKVLLAYLDKHATSAWGCGNSGNLTWLRDIPFGPHTPSRFPCIMSQFRSPVVTCSPSGGQANDKPKQIQEKKRAMTVSTNLLPEPCHQPLLQRCSKRLCDSVIVLPSKTIVHPAESKTIATALEQNKCVSKTNSLEKSRFSPARKKSKTVAKGLQLSSVCRVPLASLSQNTGCQSEGTKKVDKTLTSTKGEQKRGQKCRRRLIPLAQGQKSITSFFSRS